ncbi:UNVERIFIED_CONTAM: hypothetical protein RMT77_014575 [Armadillidium vulgare]
MSIKSEIEIKIEELVSENFQSFPHNEQNLSLPESIKKELDENSSFIKSEPRESDLEFMFNEEVRNNVIKSENSDMSVKKFDTQHRLIINASEIEKDFEVKCTSRNKPQRAVVNQQIIKKYHLEKFSCKYCNFSFKSKDELKTHLKTHNKRKFKCAHCSYECNSKSILKKHILTHSNIKLNKCSYCSYKCNRKDNLKIHMRTHAEVKLFKCSVCSYECNQKGNLKTHMLTHASIKVFKSSVCSYECNQKRNFKTHMLTHASIKIFKCSDCSYECNHKVSLKVHMQT